MWLLLEAFDARIYPLTPALQQDIISILQSYKIHQEAIAHMAVSCLETHTAAPCTPKQSRDLSQDTGPRPFRHQLFGSPFKREMW